MSEVVFVGTSDAFGAGGRRQSAIFVQAPTGGVLLDCGMTTGAGLAQLGIERNAIDAILISHFHGDHFGGIPLFLLAALYEDARRQPLLIAGPPGIEQRVRALAAALSHGIEDREWTFEIRFEELQRGRPATLGPVRAQAFETVHQPEANPHGLIVDAGARRIAYTGDTGWFDGLPRRVAGADLLICECTYHSFAFDYHLNHHQLVEHKPEFDCGRMLLTHLGQEMAHRRGHCEFETADDGLRVRL